MTNLNPTNYVSELGDTFSETCSRPSPSEQWNIITGAINSHKLELGTTWYLVSRKWLEAFHDYCQKPREYKHPGPIDNQDIACLNTLGSVDFGLVPLKPGLCPGEDYIAVPYEMWKLLEEWHGVSNKCSRPIARPVTIINGEKQIEYDPPTLRIRFLDEAVKYLCISRHTRCGYLRICLTQQQDGSPITADGAGVIAQEEPRLYIFDDKNPERTVEVQEEFKIENYPGLLSGSSMLLVQTKDHLQETIKKSWGVVSLCHSSGASGLRNLGNTCYMNSALQCLSNCKALTMYFLEGRHLEELNSENPIGSGGAMAIAYGNLLRQLWDRPVPEVTLTYPSTVDPGKFKSVLAQLEPRFMGYQQHDSQELLSCLLDRLHEDVNRVRVKPYVELNDSDGRPDEVLAQEAWDNHRSRNDSVIVDYFHGQFKSTVLCPSCGYESITFDPFEFLSLPLPKPTKLRIELVTASGFDFKKVQVELDKKRGLTVAHLISQAISQGQILGMPNDFLAVEVFNNEVYRVFQPSFPLDDINFPSDEVILYSIAGHRRSLWLSLRNETFPGCSSALGDPILIDAEEAEDDCQAARNYMIQKLSVQLKNISELEALLSIEPDYSLQASDALNSGVIVRVLKQKLYDILGKSVDDVFAEIVPQFKTPRLHEPCTSQSLGPPAITLKDCLTTFCSEEKLSEDELWYCKKCKVHQAAFKKMDLWRLPRILIIHLKRFSYSRMWGEKLNVPVNFPVRDLVLPSCHKPYELFSVSNHFGSLGGGHYTAFAKNFHNNRWYTFDDSHVSEGDISSLQTSMSQQAAYLLFYAQTDKAV